MSNNKKIKKLQDNVQMKNQLLRKLYDVIRALLVKSYKAETAIKSCSGCRQIVRKFKRGIFLKLGLFFTFILVCFRCYLS